MPEDTVPDPEPTTDTEVGDIFNLGPHRLLCGDATAAWSYQALLGEERAGLVFTDPPYNVAYKGQKFGEIMNDDMAPEAFIEFSVAFMQRLHEFSREGAALYICSGYSSYPPFLYALYRAGMTFSCPIIWVKDNPSMGWEDYKKQHEMVLKARREKKRTATPILYGWNKGRHYFAADRFEADVWIMKKRAGATMLHPTQKPLSLVQRAIRNSSVKEDLVLDPFVGSGTTIIAAEREGRTARAMDLDPFNIDTTIRRYAALGGPSIKDIRATKTRAVLPSPTEKAEDARPA
jgi:DNA modification methylase